MKIWCFQGRLPPFLPPVARQAITAPEKYKRLRYPTSGKAPERKHWATRGKSLYKQAENK